MKLRSTLTLIGCILICVLIGSSGAYFTAQSVNTWYPTLVKPSFNPPNYLFGPVWTTIFILLGICLWGIIRAKSEFKATALKLFVTQFILNVTWSYLFFGIQNPSLAMMDILLLLISIIWFTITLYKIKPWLAATQILYLSWVSFASILNASIVYLN